MEYRDGSVHYVKGRNRYRAVLNRIDEFGTSTKLPPLYGATREEAIAKREQLKLRLIGAGRAWEDKDLLVDVIHYVLYHHLPSRPAQERIEQTTIDGYITVFENHLRKRLARVRLRDVDGKTFRDLQTAMDLAEKDPHTIGVAYTVIRHALAFAVEEQVLSVNVGRSIKQPRKTQPSGRRVTPVAPEIKMAQTLVEALSTGEEAHDACLVMMASGMRINETLAMREFELTEARERRVEGKPMPWRVAHNVQWLRKREGERRQHWRFGDTKNHHARDTVISDFALPALERCLQRQAAKRLPRVRCARRDCRRIMIAIPRGGLFTYTHATPPPDGHEPVLGYAPDRLRPWEEHGLLFSTRYGTPLRANTVADALEKVCLSLGMDPVLTPHSLRYAFATLLWATKRIRMETIQRMMGHLTSKITANLYVQVLQSQRDEAGEALNDLMSQRR